MSLLPSSICIFGVISHLFLFIAFIKDPLKCFKNSGTYLVANLAVSDFLICFLAPFLHHFTDQWQWYWIYMQLVIQVTTTVSLYTIASISLDRFLTVVYPLKHCVFMKGKVIVSLMVGIWIICGAFLVTVSSIHMQNYKHRRCRINIFAQRRANSILKRDVCVDIPQVEKAIQKLGFGKYFRATAAGANFEKRTIFEDNHSYSVYCLRLHRAFHNILLFRCDPELD